MKGFAQSNKFFKKLLTKRVSERKVRLYQVGLSPTGYVGFLASIQPIIINHLPGYDFKLRNPTKNENGVPLKH